MSGIPLWIVASMLSISRCPAPVKSSNAINPLAALSSAPIVRSGVRMKRATTCDVPADSGTVIWAVSPVCCGTTTASFTVTRHAG